MALAWNAGWVNALRGSNPLSSAREVPDQTSGRGLFYAILRLKPALPTSTNLVERLHPLLWRGPANLPAHLIPRRLLRSQDNGVRIGIDGNPRRFAFCPVLAMHQRRLPLLEFVVLSALEQRSDFLESGGGHWARGSALSPRQRTTPGNPIPQRFHERTQNQKHQQSRQ